jgi:Tfp pilus assembly protein PilN
MMELLQINLLPEEYRIHKRSLSWVLDLRFIIPVLVALMMGLGVFLSWVYYSRKTSRLQEEQSFLEGQIRANAPIRGVVQNLTSKLSMIEEKNKALKSIQVSRKKWVIVFENLSTTLPNNTWITGMRQEADRENNLTISGQTYNFNEIAQTMMELVQTPSVSDVELLSITTGTHDGIPVFIFSMRCSLDPELGLEASTPSVSERAQ